MFSTTTHCMEKYILNTFFYEINYFTIICKEKTIYVRFMYSSKYRFSALIVIYKRYIKHVFFLTVSNLLIKPDDKNL